MKNALKYIKILLWLIALHSFVVSILLLVLGPEEIKVFGFSEGNAFFQVQGGVFHLVMVVAYVIAAINPLTNRNIIIFIIVAKAIATIYLLMYYFMAEPVITVLLSGIVDGLMGLLLLLLWNLAVKKSDAGGSYG